MCAGLGAQGMMMQRLGDGPGALASLQLAYNTLRSLNRELTTPMLATYVFSSLVNATLATNDLPAAQRMCASAAGDTMLAKSATPKLLMGTLHVIGGDVDAALGLFNEALEVGGGW